MREDFQEHKGPPTEGKKVQTKKKRYRRIMVVNCYAMFVKSSTIGPEAEYSYFILDLRLKPSLKNYIHKANLTIRIEELYYVV